MSEKELWDQGVQVTLLIHEGAIVLHSTIAVAQAATDVLKVSTKAIRTEVTSEVEGTLLAIQHTYKNRGSIL